jgi:hypothetical protein
MKSIYSGKMRLDEWVSFFIEFIFPDDVNVEVAGPFLRYLTGLGVLIPYDEDILGWRGCDSQVSLERLTNTIQDELESLCDSESGFALPYFIGYKEILKKPIDHNSALKNIGISQKRSKSSNSNKPVSDLSNHQIVKKVGKQLQPFLQIEESIVTRLVCQNVSKQDAQKLFHYMFGKMSTKAEPRVWEQLSRKRHR